MKCSVKKVLVAISIVIPITAFAGGGHLIAKQQLAANDSAIKEGSNHTTNKKAIALEVKERQVSAAVRDWSEIDTNKDHSISPDEMETFLHGTGRAKAQD
jgi:hypothetical protein